ncbi:4Fe-4S binding protein, partial [Patescibacteria group bacterium]
KGVTFDGFPSSRGLKKFDEFIGKVNDVALGISKGGDLKKEKIKALFLTRVSPKFSRKKSKEEMGEQWVDESMCMECGTCQRGCPYGAIKLNPKPVFDHEKCAGCWYCYNHCPKKAIYTKKYKGKGQYSGPSDELIKKLKK